MRSLLTEISPEQAAEILAESGLRIASPNGQGPGGEQTATSWAPVDLLGHVAPAAPEILRRGDGEALLYRGRVHYFAGEPESLKTWAALLAGVQTMRTGSIVGFIDFEDGPGAVLERLRALGATDQEIGERFHYVRPEEPLSEAAWADLGEVLAERPALVVVDGVTEAMSLHGLDLGKNPDVARFHAMLPRRIADAGAAVVLIDHVTKDRTTRGRFALGAGHKLAGVDGAAYTFDLLQPASRGGFGLARIGVVKDRPGYVRGFASSGGRVGELYLGAEDGAVLAELRCPIEAAEDGLGPAARRVLAVLPEAGQGEMTVRMIGDLLAEDHLGPPLRARTVQRALNDLVGQGLVDGTPGDVRTAGHWWRMA
jgi:hypothetical protein